MITDWGDIVRRDRLFNMAREDFMANGSVASQVTSTNILNIIKYGGPSELTLSDLTELETGYTLPA